MLSLAERLKVERLCAALGGLDFELAADAFVACGRLMGPTLHELGRLFPDLARRAAAPAALPAAAPLAQVMPARAPRPRIVVVPVEELDDYAGERPPRWPGAEDADAGDGRAQREAAAALAAERNLCFSNAVQAYACGDGALARSLAQRGRECDRLMKAANARASARILARQNMRGLHAIDLHGLFLREALAAVQQLLAAHAHARHDGPCTIEIITGIGQHSAGAARLRPGLRRWLGAHDYGYTEREGVFLVRA